MIGVKFLVIHIHHFVFLFDLCWLHVLNRSRYDALIDPLRVNYLRLA